MLYVSVLTTTIYVRSLRYLAQRFGSCGTIYPKINRDGFEKVLSKEIEKLGWARFQEAPNFLKHADKDPDGKMEVDDIHARTGIGLGIILYQRVTDTPPSPEMQAWETIMTLEFQISGILNQIPSMRATRVLRSTLKPIKRLPGNNV